MGINILLENEQGKEVAHVDDPTNILHRLLPDHDDLSYQMLRFVDWYGNTTFNQLQAPVLISELNRINEEKAQTLEEKALIDDIVRLVTECQFEDLLYVKFYGD